MKEGGGKWILKEGLTEEKGIFWFSLEGLDLVFFFGENEEDRGGGYLGYLRRWETQRKRVKLRY